MSVRLHKGWPARLATVTRGFFLLRRPERLQKTAHGEDIGIAPAQQHPAKATLHAA
ncbi:MAG TPA: hypothetical protein VGF12_23555 [Roseateles sp.]|uniref:hypothetical protein n=1 Tax=Roseateles sp. TaxID=1971397 RepID=UPI002ED80D85